MLAPVDDTITAQATARGGACRGIVRISGRDSAAILENLFRVSVADSANEKQPFRPFVAGNSPQIVDGELLIWKNLSVPCSLYYWSEGRGFTGQQAVELHTIGSQPILDAIVRKLCETGKCRLAGRGEFTLRAFLSGKIDLPQAEAVLGVIDAQDNRQLNTALRQLAGGVGKPLAAIRERLLEMLCRLEAEFDFAEEEIEFLDRNELRQELDAALHLVEQTRRQMHERTSASEFPKVVLVGRPNAGKSRLFNALTYSAKCQISSTPQNTRENISAIVSSIPGTTRDYLEAKIQWKETAFLLFDTAGMETVTLINDDDQPRYLAQSFTHDALEQADVILFCLESGQTPTETEQKFLEENRSRILFVITKSDQVETNVLSEQSLEETKQTFEYCEQSFEKIKQTFEQSEFPIIFTSAVSGEGLTELFDEIVQRLQNENASGEVVPATALRCRESLHRAAESLQNAQELLELRQEELFIATELRIALEHLGQILGTVHNDEVLDRIFSKFCIGK